MASGLSSGHSSHFQSASSSTHGQSRSHLPNRDPKNKNTFNENVDVVENYINNLGLDVYFQLNEEEQEKHLEKIDAIELLHAVEEVNREAAFTCLENHVLIDFLQKNDPKLLIGLNQHKSHHRMSSSGAFTLRRDGSGMGSNTLLGSNVLGDHVSHSVGSRSVISRSILGPSTSGTNYHLKRTIDYKLNFHAKADMADKTLNDVEKRIREIEKKAEHEIKILRGHIEELRYTHDEAKETLKSFQLHFMKDENDLTFLNTATEKQLERKIRKFVNNWLKRGTALLSTMRLRITSLREQCTQLRSELMTKTDLSGSLTAADFEKVMIKRTQLLNSLDEKNAHMAGLKAITGKASLAMSEEKQAMMNYEEELRQLNKKKLEVTKTISKLERDALQVERENEKDRQTLNALKEQLERYEAPTVNEYLAKKNKLLMQEKEEKMLRRKIHLLQMQLANTQKKCKQQLDPQKESIE